MKYKKGKTEGSLYSTMPETLETLHAKEASELQSEVTHTDTHLRFHSSALLGFKHG